jgi:hypothetical protein
MLLSGNPSARDSMDRIGERRSDGKQTDPSRSSQRPYERYSCTLLLRHEESKLMSIPAHSRLIPSRLAEDLRTSSRRCRSAPLSLSRTPLVPSPAYVHHTQDCFTARHNALYICCLFARTFAVSSSSCSSLLSCPILLARPQANFNYLYLARLSALASSPLIQSTPPSLPPNTDRQRNVRDRTRGSRGVLLPRRWGDSRLSSGRLPSPSYHRRQREIQDRRVRGPGSAKGREEGASGVLPRERAARASFLSRSCHEA